LMGGTLSSVARSIRCGHSSLDWRRSRHLLLALFKCDDAATP
jgi:hypothetical protein